MDTGLATNNFKTEGFSGANPETQVGQKGPCVIYSLLNKQGSVFYVGKTKTPVARLSEHRRRFGVDTQMTVLQDVFDGESPVDAEKRWIRHYHVEQNAQLANFVHTGQRSKPLKIKPGGERVTISVRGISADLWRRFRQSADEKGLLLWRAFDEMIEDWTKKHDR